uniref:Ig-like domain-containing protein n=1 Tax=Steinernema glaseri TaxID=37863 RepID=A0A1I7ZU35_9BILA
MLNTVSILLLSVLFAVCQGWSVSVDPRSEDARIIDVGAPFAVICRLNGIDPNQERPGLVWTKVNGDIFHTGHVNVQRLDANALSMFVGNGAHEDDGVYECHASYQGMTKSASVELRYRENLAFVENSTSSVVSVVGNAARLSCRVVGANAENLMVMWQKDIVALTENANKEYIFADNGQTIYIPNVVVARDRGTFVCRVLNVRTGETIAKSFELGFAKAPQHVEPTCTSVCNAVCDILTTGE